MPTVPTEGHRVGTAAPSQGSVLESSASAQRHSHTHTPRPLKPSLSTPRSSLCCRSPCGHQHLLVDPQLGLSPMDPLGL